MSKTSLLIVDDDPVVRQMLPAYFNREEFDIIGVVSSAAEALNILATRHVDVVLTDIRMPRMSGVDLAREIRQRMSRVRVVAITSFDEDEYVVEALRAGTNGIVLKSAPPDVITEAVLTTAKNQAYIEPVMAQRLGQYLAPATKESALVSSYADQAIQPPELTARESEVLNLLLDGLSNQEIALELRVSIAAVKKHIAALFVKYGVQSRLKLVIAALRTENTEKP